MMKQNVNSFDRTCHLNCWPLGAQTRRRSRLSKSWPCYVRVSKTSPEIGLRDQAELSGLRRLAAQGRSTPRRHLGFLYYCGQGVPQDYAQAAQWYRKAADQGDELAQFQVGEMYRQGQGVPQDYAQAVDWLRKSAEQGFDEAAWSLAEMYSLGQGLPQDLWRSR